MTNFLLFAASPYASYGGMGDCKGVFDTLEDAQAKVTSLYKSGWGMQDWANFHILELSDVKLVHEYRGDGTMTLKPLDTYLNERD
jgi:hypothetical protein